MPHSSDDPPNASPAEGSESEAPYVAPPSVASEETSPGADAPSASREGGAPRRRRRRRRRGPPFASPPGEAPAGGEGQIEKTASVDTLPAGENSPVAPTADGEPPPLPRRRRRRRRGPPREASAGAQAAGTAPGCDAAVSLHSEGAAPLDEAVREQPRRRHRLPPHAGGSTDPQLGGPGQRIERPRGTGLRDRRRRTPGERESESRGPGSPEQRPRDSGPGGTTRREAGRREEGAASRGSRGMGAKSREGRGGRSARDRDAPQKRPPPKLYALEAVVDRGFEDIADDADESAARRVHWTIIKRTVADQKSGKPMSAVYVLQREGIDSEFPNLGAARAAVNKTIVHPEKLTLSKAEHAAAKK
jgi:hypothetical protein